MPRFGGFETMGAPAEVTQERGHVATVWQARRVGGGDNRLFAIKVYCARQATAETTAAEEGRNGQRHRAFLEGVKQLKNASTGGKNRNLIPVYEQGFADEGAWYATDYYARGSLKTWISRLGEVDGAALRHVLHEVITGCLSLKEARGYGHGNLKPANVFLTGKPRPLRETRLVLGDPYPAAPLKLAQLDFANRSTTELLQLPNEAQDVRALGELILQLVEGRLIHRPSAYTYPIVSSERWQKLGGDEEYWRQMCNRLLDPELSLTRVNLSVLEEETRSKEPDTRIPKVVTGIGLVCLLVLGGVVAVKYFKPGKSGDKVAISNTTGNAATGDVATENVATGNVAIANVTTGDATKALRTAQMEFGRGNYSEVQAICAKYLNDPRFANLAQSAITEQQELQQAQKSFAKGDYSFIDRLQKYSSKAPFASLLKQAEEERQLLKSLWALTNSVPELKQRLSDTNVASIKKPPFEQLREWVAKQPTIDPAPTEELETAQNLFKQGEYQEVLTICAKHPNESRFTSLASSATAEKQELEQARSSFANGDYRFIETLRAQEYSSKGPFAALLEEAKREQQLLAELQALKNSVPKLQQRLSEPDVARITKSPFEELRKWAGQQSGTLAAQAKDIKAARELLGQGSYRNVLEICARYPNVPAFTELEASARAEETALTTGRASFERGDYDFVDSLAKEPFSKKPAFARLLDDAKDERELLQQLQALQQKGDWGKLYARMVKSEASRLKKPPFEELRESLVLRHQELIKQLRRLQARLGTLPRGEKTPLDAKGKPVVMMSRNLPATPYNDPVRQLKQDFQEIDLLTEERKREFQELEKKIFRWFDSSFR